MTSQKRRTHSQIVQDEAVLEYQRMVGTMCAEEEDAWYRAEVRRDAAALRALWPAHCRFAGDDDDEYIPF